MSEIIHQYTEPHPGLLEAVPVELIPSVAVPYVKQRNAAEEQLRMAQYDKLTHALTRQAGEEELRLMSEKFPGEFFVSFVDLDDFKKANDSKGHETGDEIPTNIADVMGRLLKIRDGSLIRWGGDEFLMVYQGGEQGNDQRKITTEEEMVTGLEQRVKNSVKKVAEVAGVPFVGASIGTVKHVPGEPVAEMVKRADAKMYEDKATKDTRSAR